MSSENSVKDRVQALVSRGGCAGPLTEAEIARGAHLCWSNAVSLLSEARLLAQHSRLARGLALTVLALEELAKPPLLWTLAPSDDSEKWRAFWKEQFSRHSPKQKAIGRYGQLLEATGHGIYDLQVNEAIVDALDRLKQWGFYVDCVDGAFQAPDELAAKLPEILDFLFAIAEERADSFAKFHASVEQSSWTYEHRHVPLIPSVLWPPPLRSETDVRGLLLSLASQYSRSQPPDYYAFGDACEQIAEKVDASMLNAALKVVGRQAYKRTQCTVLQTSATRGFLMMKLAVHALPEEQRRPALEEWKSDGGD